MEKAKSLNMPAVAMTDAHQLFGAVDFYLEAKKKGINPILGCEINYVPLGKASLSPQSGAGQPVAAGPRAFQIVLLAKSLKGYQNLCQMISQSYYLALSTAGQKAVMGVPAVWVDRELLFQYAQDLIVLSGGLRGELSWLALSNQEEEAAKVIQQFKDQFGEDFYLELQDTQIPEQNEINQKLHAWSEKLGVQCVATTECHYLNPQDAEAHEILQCIQLGRTLDFERPKSLVPAEFWFKPAELMIERMAAFPGACENTLKIAEKCKTEFKFKDEKGQTIYHLPKFRPEGVGKDDVFDLIAYFKAQAAEGLEVRFQEHSFEKKKLLPSWPELEKEYRDRLVSELAMIERTGFAGYFLIVSDFIKWAKSQNIPVGPGRGSGAGSLVAYSLKITDIDPIQYKLLFERFINPERISMPDFDVDFCQDRRGEVIDYVARKYGKDNVCQIITFGKLQTKAAIKDVARVLGFSFAESDQLTKLVPDELGISIQSAIDQEPRLREKIEQDPKVAKVFEYAKAVEGLSRNTGIHAAGVIITENPVREYCPLLVTPDGDVVTQFDKDFAEKIGLIKYDFLGLKTLTVIDYAVKMIQMNQPFDLQRIDYEDPAVFALISSGDTDGIFQVESSGMKDLCMRIQPNSVEDLTAIGALFRPGPLGSGMVDVFIDRKHGRVPITYDVPALATILKDTYGVILYQEQVMQIARELAGYSLGQADLLRRAMGKKDKDEMARHRDLFTQGAIKNGLAADKAVAIFELMAKFAEYGFNKSHSAAYAVLTYQTAFLKTHFAPEFMAALMSTEVNNTDKITKYISDARQHSIPVLSPDVNHSGKSFSVEGRSIRFGLEAIKGVGGIAVDTLIEARTQKKFTSVLDFCQRVSTRKVNKKVLESLILAGAFDEIAEVNRASLFASIEKLLEHASDEQEERELGQSSLFDAFQADDIKLLTPIGAIFKSESDWPQSRKLSLEKQVVGFYISGHPMDGWQKICDDWLGWNTEKLKEYTAPPPSKAPPAEGPPMMGGRQRPQRKEIRMGGLISEMKEITTKKGTRMAFVQFEDIPGRCEVIFFPEAYAQTQEMIRQAMAQAEPVVLTGDIDAGDEGNKVLVRTVEWLAEAHKNRAQQVVLTLDTGSASPDQLRELKKQLLQFRGNCPVRIQFKDAQFKTKLDLPKTVKVSPAPQLVENINRIFGASVVQIQ